MTLVTIIKDSNFYNGHRSLVTIVSGTEIVKSSALPVDTEYTVFIKLKVNERNLGNPKSFQQYWPLI